MRWLTRWIGTLLLALDQLGNAILGGSADETISSRLGRHRDRWWGRAACRVLDGIDANHCRDAVQAERDRAHLPPDLR